MTGVTAIPLKLHRNRFDPDRVRALARDDHLLVIDQVSGRWTTVDNRVGVLLPLVGIPPVRLPAAVRSTVARLRELLLASGVGVLGGEQRVSGLTTVILKLTNACNHACAYCYDFDVFEKARTLDRDVAVTALAEALDIADRELTVILHGGEPMLLWPLIEDLVVTGERLAAERGRTIRFVGQSNFSRTTDRVVAFSIEHDIRWEVSIDGPPPVHDQFRTDHQSRGTYAQFAASLARYPDFVRSAGVLSTITAASQHLLLPLARYFRDLGMPSWDWSLFQPIGRSRGGAERFGLAPGVLADAWEELYDAVEAGEFDGFAVMPVTKYLDNLVSGPGGNLCLRGDFGAARDLLSISSDGTVEACDCIGPNGPLSGLGTVHDGLAATRRSDVATAIRHRDLSGSPCGDCLWLGVCGGTCLAHAPSLNEVWDAGCALAPRAFDRISLSLVRGDRLLDYLRSLRPAGRLGARNDRSWGAL